MSYAIKLEHENLLPGSEVITVPGGQFTALVRDEDYVIDYVNGIVTVIPTGVVTRLPGNDDVALNITYKRKVDFSSEYTLQSHIEVFSEVATITDSNVLQVENKPIRGVQRVLNRTTGEEYTVNSFSEDKIYISGTTLPRLTTLEDQPAEVYARTVNGSVFTGTVNLVLSDRYIPAKEHPLSNVLQLRTQTLDRQLIRGGIDIVESSYDIEITNNTREIELRTGSTILRRSNIVLIPDTDYVTSTSSNILTIIFTDSGISKIGNNSLYYRLFKIVPITDNQLIENDNIDSSQHRISFTERYISEVVTFSADGKASLTKYSPFIEIAQEIDQEVAPTLVVTNQSGTTTFVENEDYIIDPVFGRLIRIDTSPRLDVRQTVKIIYIDQEQFTSTYTIASDVILVDYDWGNNAIDWSSSFSENQVQEEVEIHEGARFFRLQNYPSVESVNVTQASSGASIQVVDVDISNRRVQIEPAPTTGTYLVSYVARDQTVNPGNSYFVGYSYGARRRALIDNFAAQLGLTTSTVFREEEFDFVNGQSSVVLSYIPTDIERINIYITNDPDEDPQAEPLSFDTSTGILRFTPVISANNYTVEYPVVGFETETLRSAIIALLEALTNGPNKRSVEIIGEALTGITPDVTESIDNGFLLTDSNDTDYLAALSAQASPNLSDGTSSIEYVPSRFNNGVSLRAANDAWVAHSAISNLRIEEGSISFLTGTYWDGDDKKSHYFIDARGTNDNTNRLVIYKNKRGFLVFEIHDRNSKLFRVTKDIRWIARNEIFYLREGDSTTTLTHSPAYTIIDLDGDEQSDIFGAHRTEFVITPSFQGPGDPSLNITTLVRIDNSVDYTDQNAHSGAAYRLRTLANVYEKHGAKITVETESSFMQGCALYDNVLSELYQRGHGVQIFVDLPQDVISDDDRELYILERRSLLNGLGIAPGDTDGISGGYEIDYFATIFPELGFDMATAYVDPLSGAGLDNRTAVFRADTGSDFSIPNPNGELIYVPGDVSIQYQKNPMIVQSFIPITNSLLTAIEKAKPDVVNSWYFLIGIGDFTAGEVSLFDQWLGSTVDPLIQVNKIAWKTPSEIVNLFREHERFLEINRNRVRFVSSEYGPYGPYGQYGWGGTQSIRALSWDEVTNTLTFDPVDKSGFYLFSYVSGFSKYEEAEHLITCTWKLHTDDGQPPMVKMYLDGELVNHKIWGDL